MLTMRSINSSCLVCGNKFQVSLDQENVFPFPSNNFSIFCEYFSTKTSKEEENDKKLWNSFSFCKPCEGSIGKLNNLHEQLTLIQTKICQNVQKIGRQILKTQNRTECSHKLTKNDPNKNLQFHNPTNWTSSSTKFEQTISHQKIIVKNIVTERIQNINESICKHYKPTVILNDCNDEAKPKKTNQSWSASIESKEEFSTYGEDENSKTRNEGLEFNSELNSTKQEPLSPSSYNDTWNENDDEDGNFNYFPDEINETHNVEQPSGQITKSSNSGPSHENKKRSKRLKWTKLPKKARVDNENDDDDDNLGLQEDDDEDWCEEVELGLKKSDTDKSESGKNKRTFWFSSTCKYVMLQPGVFQYQGFKFQQTTKGGSCQCQCGVTLRRRCDVVKHIDKKHTENALDEVKRKKLTVDDEGTYHFLGYTFKLEDGIFKCGHCPWTSKSKSSLCRHIGVKHDTSRPTCHICEKSWDSQRKMDKHICKGPRKLSKIKFVPLGEGNYIYDKKWPFSEKWEDGVKVGYSCGTCGAVKRIQERISSHIRECHIAVKSFVCEICGHKAMTQSLLRKHQARHTEEKNFICEECGMSHRTITDLRNHMTRHTTGPVECAECGKSYSHRTALNRHCNSTGHRKPERKSTAVEYHCPKCFRDLRSQSVLEQHMAKCSGQRPFQCSICQHISTEERFLKIHMSNVHNLEMESAQNSSEVQSLPDSPSEKKKQA